MLRPKTFKKKSKPSGFLPLLPYLIAILVALVVAVSLPSTEQVKAWAIGVFLAIAAGGGVILAIAALLKHLLRKKRFFTKTQPVLDWIARIGATLITAGLIATFYSSIIK
jgi:hypothetical protein